MIIKPKNSVNNSINPFYLYGFNEIGLAKAFTFTLFKNRQLLFKFLRYVGINIINSENNYKLLSIQTEKVRPEGRTDIEIELEHRFHLIIEAKVGGNIINDQKRQQYIDSFSANANQKTLYFITQTNDYLGQIENGITVKNISWTDIDYLIDDPTLLEDNVVREFQSYIRRGYKLRSDRDILIQDVGESEKIKYLNSCLYRRDKVSGSPLYFSPYFTGNANYEHGQGIWFLSKILGIITCKAQDIECFKDDLLEFANNVECLVAKWINGCNSDVIEENNEKVFTFFFLDNPVELIRPLVKNNDADWIHRNIPKNRCVSYKVFVEQMIKQI